MFIMNDKAMESLTAVCSVFYLINNSQYRSPLFIDW